MKPVAVIGYRLFFWANIIEQKVWIKSKLDFFRFIPYILLMATKGRNGGAKTGGRKKGTPNKVTTEMKEMAMAALDEVGGQKYFVKQAKENPVAFMNFIRAYVPAEVKMDAEMKGQLTFNFIRAIPERDEDIKEVEAEVREPGRFTIESKGGEDA